MLLSEDHIAVQDAVRTYVQAEIAPRAAAWDKGHTFPAAQLKGLAAGKVWPLSQAAACGAISACT